MGVLKFQLTSPDLATRIGQTFDTLDKLETQHGVKRGTFGTIELRAQLLEKSGEGDKALSMLREYVAQNRDQVERL